MTWRVEPVDAERHHRIAFQLRVDSLDGYLAKLEERRELVERGEAVVHDDAEVRRRLRDLGVPLVGPGPTE